MKRLPKKVEFHRNIGPEYKDLDRKVYSLKSRRTEDYGKVLLHAAEISASFCTFHVSKPGRQRTKETGQKNVHAVIRSDDLEAVHTEDDTFYSDSLGNMPRLQGVAAAEIDPNDRYSEVLEEMGYTRISYEPHNYPYFFERGTGRPVKAARHVVAHASDVFANDIEFHTDVQPYENA